MTTLESIGFNLVAGGSLGTLAMVAFGWAVAQRHDFVAPRCTARPRQVIYPGPIHPGAVHDDGSHRFNPVLDWIPWTLSLTYDTMLRGVPMTGTRRGGQAGALLRVNLDAIVLLRFHAVCLKLAALASILFLLVLLPMYVSGNCYKYHGTSSSNNNATTFDQAVDTPCSANLTNYERTTIANVPGSFEQGTGYDNVQVGARNPQSTVRLYFTVFCFWIVQAYLLHLLKREWIEILALRRVYYLESDVWGDRQDELKRVEPFQKEAALMQLRRSRLQRQQQQIRQQRKSNSGSGNNNSSSNNNNNIIENDEEDNYWEHRSLGKLPRDEEEEEEDYQRLNVRDPWIPHPEHRNTVPNIQLYSVMVGGLPSLPPPVQEDPSGRNVSIGDQQISSVAAAAAAAAAASGATTSTASAFEGMAVPPALLSSSFSRFLGRASTTTTNVPNNNNNKNVPPQQQSQQQEEQQAPHRTVDWHLALTAAFFDHCVPNQPGFSSSVAAVTVLPSSKAIASAWRKWYKAASKHRRLRFLRRAMDLKIQEQQREFEAQERLLQLQREQVERQQRERQQEEREFEQRRIMAAEAAAQMDLPPPPPPPLPEDHDGFDYDPIPPPPPPPPPEEQDDDQEEDDDGDDDDDDERVDNNNSKSQNPQQRDHEGFDYHRLQRTKEKEEDANGRQEEKVEEAAPLGVQIRDETSFLGEQVELEMASDHGPGKGYGEHELAPLGDQNDDSKDEDDFNLNSTYSAPKTDNKQPPHTASAGNDVVENAETSDEKGDLSAHRKRRAASPTVQSTQNSVITENSATTRGDKSARTHHDLRSTLAEAASTMHLNYDEDVVVPEPIFQDHSHDEGLTAKTPMSNKEINTSTLGNSQTGVEGNNGDKDQSNKGHAFGPEQYAIYSREYAQAAAPCCPNGCCESAVNHCTLEELKLLEFEAMMEVRKANEELFLEQQKAKELQSLYHFPATQEPQVAPELESEQRAQSVQDEEAPEPPRGGSSSFSLSETPNTANLRERKKKRKSSGSELGLEERLFRTTDLYKNDKSSRHQSDSEDDESGSNADALNSTMRSSARSVTKSNWDKVKYIVLSMQQELNRGGSSRKKHGLSMKQWPAITGAWEWPKWADLLGETKDATGNTTLTAVNMLEDFIDLSRESTYAVVTFTSRQAAVAARQCLTDGRATGRWRTGSELPIPPLADAAACDLFMFRNCCRPVTMSIDDRQKTQRHHAVMVFLAGFYIMSPFALSLFASILKPQTLEETMPKLFRWLEARFGNGISETVSGFLQSSLYTLFFALCPVFFKALANFGSSAPSVANAELRALQYFWWFMVVSAFWGTLIAQMFLLGFNYGIGGGKLSDVLLEMARAVPSTTAATWLNWINLRTTFVITAQYLLQMPTFLYSFLGLKCCSRLTRGGGPGPPTPYRLFVDSGTVLLSLLALGPASPLIAPASFLYFLWTQPVLRRCVIFVYRPKFDGGGLRWPFVHDMTISSLLVGHILLTLQMVLKQAPGPAILAALPMLVTLLAYRNNKKQFLGPFRDAALLQTSLLDGWDSTEETTMDKREAFRRFLVDAHKAAYVPVCLAGPEKASLTSEPAVVVPLETDFSPENELTAHHDDDNGDEEMTPLSPERGSVDVEGSHLPEQQVLENSRAQYGAMLRRAVKTIQVMQSKVNEAKSIQHLHASLPPTGALGGEDHSSLDSKEDTIAQWPLNSMKVEEP